MEGILQKGCILFGLPVGEGGERGGGFGFQVMVIIEWGQKLKLQ